MLTGVYLLIVDNSQMGGTADVFLFTNYRDYLNEILRRAPNSGRGIKRKIALRLGVHSSLVSQIFHGSKSFTGEQAIELAAMLRLEGVRLDYFLRLIEIERAGSQRLRSYLKQQMQLLRENSNT